MKTKRILVAILALLIVGQGPVMVDHERLPVAGIAAVQPVQIPAHYLLELIFLKPLPKPLYGWRVDLEVLRNPANAKFLIQFVRITGSLGVGDPWMRWTDRDLEIANDIAIAGGGGLVIHTSPYHRAGSPGCNSDPLDWSDTGNELAFTAKFFQNVKVLDLRVSCIVMDSECYKKPHESVTRRLNMMFELAKGFFPDVPIRWYRNGDWAPNLDARNDGNQTFYQYRTYSAVHTEQWLDRWEWKLPNEYSVAIEKSWSVWISLGPGYRDRWQWKLNLDEAEYRYLGRMHAVDDRLTDVLLYPDTFRPSTMPESLDAFIAYVKGMTGK